MLRLGVTLAAAALTLVAAGYFPNAPAGSAPAEAAGVEAGRFLASGGIYQADGFRAFPNAHVPFDSRRGLPSRRLRGRLIHLNPDGLVIGHSFACGPYQTVYLEYWLRDRRGGLTAFAWQDLSIVCMEGGEPSPRNPLYLDLTGNGRPELKIPEIGQISTLAHQGGTAVRTFTVDVIPAWVKERLGADLAGLADAHRNPSAPEWQDSPAWLEPHPKRLRNEP